MQQIPVTYGDHDGQNVGYDVEHRACMGHDHEETLVFITQAFGGRVEQQSQCDCGNARSYDGDVEYAPVRSFSRMEVRSIVSEWTNGEDFQGEQDEPHKGKFLL